ncbi:hypothetical protein [Streptomyces sp. Tue6028]|uniref:hypothetical protein n=1 Tax=Streptomyces sp. Tue6028 TaxID=2036037 RepID=UPI003D70B44A
MHDPAVAHATHLGPTRAWKRTTLADTAVDLYVTYGVSDQNLPAHQGVVRAGDIRDGRVTPHQPGRGGAAGPRDTRAVLRKDDLAVVLVRRVGDAALITEEHEGWMATRSVGIIRSKEPHITRWLRIWLRTPPAQAWIDRHVTAHVEPTLSLDALKKMPVLLPPPEQVDRLHELVTLIEAKTRLNLGIATDAVQLADAHYATWGRQRESWPTCAFGTVTRATTGKAVPSSPPPDGISAAWAAPSDVLNASLPYLSGTGRQSLTAPNVVCEPGTILLATRPEGARAVVTLRPAAPGRNVLGVSPVDPTDRWWILHEIRSRSEELPKAAQGRQARAITQRAFSRLDIGWPEPDVRRRFHRVAEPLHSLAQKMLDENLSLNELLRTLLSVISPGAGLLK